MPDEEYDSADWETESEESTRPEVRKRVAIPPLLPVPVDLASPADKLCDTCKALQLSAKRFVVVPGDGEMLNKPDTPNISLGLVEDILKKTYCPFCRLVIVALGGSEVPAFEDGDPVYVVMSWNTNGPIPNPDESWNHIPQIRVLRPYARRLGGGYVRSTRLNMFPEITLLANDSPIPSTTFFVRPILQDKIDFGMVRNWISICETWHGQECNKAKMLEHEVSHPADEIPAFRFIDVVDNCLVRGVSKSKYAALSYVWGGAEFIRTLKNNVGVLEQPGALKIPEFYERIALTIRDAMQVVQEIGIRFLWVDSLCIVQDDDTGEKAEAISKMDLVYGAAFVTIMAATGKNAHAGLPGVRPETRRYRQPIEEIMPGLRLAFKPIYVNHIKDSVYYTRAWT
jgi:Heterokaryon incompatibility protein (HET)